MPALQSDLRWAWRSLRARRIASLVHVVLVALAIGASTVAFSATDAFVFTRAPYPNAERLVVFERSTPVGMADYLTYEDEQALAPRRDLFSAMHGHSMGAPVYVTADGATRSVRTQDVELGLFEALGVRPRWGRGFLPADALPGVESVVVIAEELARGLFGDPTAALGKTIDAPPAALHIVGVMPDAFRFPTAQERIWRVTDSLRPTPKRARQVVAVVAAGVPIAAVEDAVAQHGGVAAPGAVPGPIAAVPLSRAQKDPRAYTNYGAYSGVDAPRLFATMLAAAIGLAGIVCLNVAGLELASALGRSRVHGILTALGATSATLVRSALLESAALTAAGTMAGIGLAVWGTTALSAALPQALAAVLVNPIDLDMRAAIFIAAVALATSLLTSMPVVWHVTRRDPAEGLRSGARNFAGSRAQSSLRQALLTAQVALCVLLLAGSVLFVRTYAARLHEPTGFNATNLATVEISLPRGSTRSAAEVDRDALSSLRSHPAVVAVSRTQGLPPYQRGGSASHVWIEGQPGPAGQAAFRTFGVDPDTFGTMGIALLSGRAIRAGDSADRVVVDAAFARRFWPEGSAVGGRFSLGREQSPGRTPYEIVGIASRVRLDAAEAPMGGTFHVMHRAIPADAAPLTFVARLASPQPFGDVTAAVRAAAGDAVVRMGWMDDRYAETFGGARIAAGLTGGFGIVAVAVAMAGLYGVTAFLVSGRTREIGIRRALGADRREIRRVVTAPALRAVIVGGVAGTAAAFAGARLVESQLFGVSAGDPSTYAAVIAAIAVASFAATWAPAARAARVDPAAALRTH